MHPFDRASAPERRYFARHPAATLRGCLLVSGEFDGDRDETTVLMAYVEQRAPGVWMGRPLPLFRVENSRL